MESWEYRSSTVKETVHLGFVMGKHAYEGLCLALAGDMGAGKTHLTKGIAAGLGIQEEITSPTFTLLNEYERGGRFILHHFDLYRLDTEDELYNIGFYEYSNDGVTVIEWADKFSATVPFGAVWVYLTREDQNRHIVFQTEDLRAAQWLREVRNELVGD